MTGVLVWATVVGLFLHVPTWAGIFLSSLTGASFLFYLLSYVYLLINDRESLRRERITANDERAIESGSPAVGSPVVGRGDHGLEQRRRPDA
jgi:hypothetical protein